ncbi:hypothetical protein NMG60_11022495 [Bertholletia excelsa]
MPWKHRTSQSTRSNCNKMYVPGSGVSPEAKAANNLHHFFTYIAVKIVSAQLKSYNREAYGELMECLSSHSLNDGDKFCADLTRESPRHQRQVPKLDKLANYAKVAFHIVNVRSAYCKTDFEWDNLKRLSSKVVGESNTWLMSDYVLETTRIKTGSEK